MTRKTWIIARREYGAMVATKAFLFSIAMMPVLMFGGIFAASRVQNMGDSGEKIIVVVDGSGGVLLTELQQAAEAHNAMAADGGTAAAKYIIERHPADGITDKERLALSNRVRNEEIKAFAEIPSGLLDIKLDAEPRPQVSFYAQNAMLSAERAWFDRVLNEAITQHRLKALELDVEEVKQAIARVPVMPLGLVRQSADGGIEGAAEGQRMAGIFVPFTFMLLMFMVIFMSAQPLLESVMEEKSGRIAEVLLGSVNASQLMLGKLLGNVAGSLTVVAIYAAGGYVAAAYNGWTNLLPVELVPWFLVYQILAVLLFSSIFMAVGAAVNQLKEAQSLLLPVWLLLASPMFVWLQIVREPNGSIARWMSLFPPATPLVMVVRLASEAVIPLWQIIFSLILLIAATGLCVYLAGRVFRIGMLWQGKTPQLRELAIWAWRG